MKAAPAIFLLFWSGGFAAGKVGLAYTGPLTFLTLRYALVLLVLLPLVLILRPPLPRTPAAWGHLLVVGFLIQGLYFALGYLALAMDISSGAVALILSLQPILVALAAPRISGERVGRWAWVGLGLGLAGAALVILAKSAVEALPALGVLAAVGALGGMTVGTLYEKRFGIAQHPVTANTVQYAAGLATTLPLAFLLEDHTVEWSLPLGLSLLYLIVCNSLIALTLLLMMIRRGEVSRVSALFFLVPPMAALIGWLVLDEQMPATGLGRVSPWPPPASPSPPAPIDFPICGAACADLTRIPRFSPWVWHPWRVPNERKTEDTDAESAAVWSVSRPVGPMSADADGRQAVATFSIRYPYKHAAGNDSRGSIGSCPILMKHVFAFPLHPNMRGTDASDKTRHNRTADTGARNGARLNPCRPKRPRGGLRGQSNATNHLRVASQSGLRRGAKHAADRTLGP